MRQRAAFADTNSLANNALTDSFSHGALWGYIPGAAKSMMQQMMYERKGDNAADYGLLVLSLYAAAACIFSASLVWI
jgi:hypothetical protein